MARSIAMTQAGTSFYARQTYFPYGAPRTTEGSALPTDNTFTAQKSDDSTGLLFYNARYYDTTLGRFTQPDTIVPNPLNPQSLNRFAYVLNNPLKYTDPTGHVECWDEDCNGGPSGGGGDNGGGSSGNVNPCNADPTAEGCPGAQEAVTPAETGQNQGSDDDNNCNEAQCGGEEKALSAAQCGQHAIDCEEADRAYKTSLLLDKLIFNVAIAGEAIGLGGALGGAILCSETGPGLVACAVGGYLAGAELAYYTTGLAGASLSLVSTGFTLWGDYNAGETRRENGAIRIGQNSANSIVTTLGGIFSPDPTVDLVIAGTQYYVNDLHQVPSDTLPPPLRWFAFDGPVILNLPN